MAVNWKRVGGEAIDYGLLATGPGGATAQAALTLGTGKSAGEWVTGEETTTSNLGGDLFGAKSKRDANSFQQMQTAAQKKEAADIEAELANRGRPTMTAALDQQKEIVDLAGRYAQEGMPEAQRQMAEDNIARSQSQALSGASSLGAGLRALPQAQTQANQGYQQLASQDAQMANNNRSQYLGQMGNLASLQGQAEGYNVLMPYEQKMQEMQALKASSLNNQWNMYQQQIAQGQANQQLAMDAAGMAVQAAPLLAASDARLKENISHTGYSVEGIPTYTWNYKGGDVTFKGAMAQDLLETNPEAVVVMDSGYYGVNYSKIDVTLELVK